MKIRKDDMVVVLSGKDNYTNDKDFIEKKEVKAHKVLSVDPKGGKAIVEGVNVATKHQKPRKQGEEGGIIKVSTPIYVSKLALYCPKCKKGVRVKSVLDGDKKVRACTKCGTVI
jgi:large subunit ribosomal protein L24